ncbi:MAG: hypothetical protein PVI26_07055 [Chitinispirillia bacterium]
MKKITGLFCVCIFIYNISCASFFRGLIHNGPDFDSSSSECSDMDRECDQMYEYRKEYRKAPRGERKRMEKNLRMYEERCNEAYKKCYEKRQLK